MRDKSSLMLGVEKELLLSTRFRRCFGGFCLLGDAPSARWPWGVESWVEALLSFSLMVGIFLLLEDISPWPSGL